MGGDRRVDEMVPDLEDFGLGLTPLNAQPRKNSRLGSLGVNIQGKTMGELFPPEFAAQIAYDDQAAIANGQSLDCPTYSTKTNTLMSIVRTCSGSLKLANFLR